MEKNKHIFKVWHPSYGLPVVYKDKEFSFLMPISRTYARYIVEKIENYVIEKSKVVKPEGSYIHRPRPKKQKI